jgi:hypothetical protein
MAGPKVYMPWHKVHVFDFSVVYGLDYHGWAKGLHG